MSTTQNPNTVVHDTVAAGWYPDAQVAGQVRYFDGQSWTEHTAPETGVAGLVNAAQPPAKKKAKKGLWITLGIVGAIIVLIIAVSAGSGGSSDDEPQGIPAAEAPVTVEEEPAAEQAPVEEAPAAPEADGSVETPYAQPYIGKTLFGTEKYSLTAAVTNGDAWGEIHEHNMFNTEPPAGYKYVIADLAFTGIDADGTEPSTEVWVTEIANAAGQSYEAEWITWADGTSDVMDAPTLYPGQAFTGRMAFIVPADFQAGLLKVGSDFFVL